MAAPATELAVSTTALSKTFGTQLVVDHLSMEVPRGAVYGFLGPNGSGKTTTIRMLLGLVSPSSGSRSVLGTDMGEHAVDVLPRVGALVEGPAFHPYLSARANLLRLDAADAAADARTSARRVDAALDRVGLLHSARKRFRAYSLGMRQRLGIAAALLVPRDLLVLDEPTNGLDPQGTREVRTLVGSFAADGTTVLVSSHLLAEIEQVCSHLGVMSRGRLVAQGTADDIRRTATAHVRVRTSDVSAAVQLLTARGLSDVLPRTDGVDALLGDSKPEALVAALVHAGVGVRGFEVVTPSLEDLFVQLTGEGFDVGE